MYLKNTYHIIDYARVRGWGEWCFKLRKGNPPFRPAEIIQGTKTMLRESVPG